jgi:protein-tyrosine phosphatase
VSPRPEARSRRGTKAELASLPDRGASAAHEWKPDLSWISPHLAIGGSFPTARAGVLARDLAIRAIVDLRSEACDDEAALGQHGIAFLHLPTPDHAAITDRMLADGVAFVNRYLDQAQRVLVHCEHGIGRSATLALCILVSRGLDPLEALERAKTRRALVSPSPAQYEAWQRWLQNWSLRHPAGWELPSFDAFKAIAYRHLQPGPCR